MHKPEVDAAPPGVHLWFLATCLLPWQCITQASDPLPYWNAMLSVLIIDTGGCFAFSVTPSPPFFNNLTRTVFNYVIGNI